MRASRSAGCSGGYVLDGAESRGKAAVAARAVMLGGGVVVVRVKGFGVEDDVGGSEDGLVVITVEGVVGVGSAGHRDVAGSGGGIGDGVVFRAILSIEGIPARIVHGLAIVADAEFEVAWVVVVVAAMVTVADVVAIVARCLACGVVFEVSGTVLWGLCLRLRYLVRIAIIYA